MKVILALSIFLAHLGCSSPPKKPSQSAALGPSSSSSDELKIIDVHAHTFGMPQDKETEAQIAERYFAALQEAGVVATIAHTRDLKDGYISGLKDKGVTHCAGLREKIDYTALEEGLKAGTYSCIKIYLGYVHRYAYEEPYRRAYKIAEKYQVPVVFHTGDTYIPTAKVKYADPLTIDEVAVDFPRVKFVIAHCGNPWIQSAAEVAYKNANVYLDVSAFLIGNLDEMPDVKIQEQVVKPLTWMQNYVEDPSKFMFGSDYPLTNIASYVRAIKKAFPKEHWQKVFRDNAVEVFNLKPKGRSQ